MRKAAIYSLDSECPEWCLVAEYMGYRDNLSHCTQGHSRISLLCSPTYFCYGCATTLWTSLSCPRLAIMNKSNPLSSFALLSSSTLGDWGGTQGMDLNDKPYQVVIALAGTTHIKRLWHRGWAQFVWRCSVPHDGAGYLEAHNVFGGMPHAGSNITEVHTCNIYLYSKMGS
jgi:hypothetical protein